MPKFHKQTFLNKTTQEIKVFGYNVPVRKKLVEKANLQDIELNIYEKDGKIIIEKNIDKQKF